MEEEINEIHAGQPNQHAPNWNEKTVLEKLLLFKDALVCDALLNPEIFQGLGNLVRNEVLFKTGIHPLSRIGAVTRPKLQQLIRETHSASLEFHKMVTQGMLHVQWEVHKQDTCPKHGLPLRIKLVGRLKTPAYYCEKCQVLYV